MLPSLLRAAIERHLSSGPTARDLAARSGVHEVNLSRFRAGKGRLGLAALERLAGAMGLAVRLVAAGEARSWIDCATAPPVTPPPWVCDFCLAGEHGRCRPGDRIPGEQCACLTRGRCRPSKVPK